MTDTTPATTVRTAALCYDYPLRPNYIAQLVVPRDMTTAEAERLCKFINALVMP